MSQTEKLIGQVNAAHDKLARQFLQEDLCAVVDSTLTMQQAKLMAVLYAAGGVSGQDLARRLEVSTPTVSGIVERLLERDMLRRFPAPHDRRVRMLELTREGEDVMRAFHELGWRLGREVMLRMSVEDLGALARGLSAMAEAAQAVPGPGGQARAVESLRPAGHEPSAGESLQPEAGHGHHDPEQGA